MNWCAYCEVDGERLEADSEQAAAHLRLIAKDLRGQGADVRIVRFSEDGVTDQPYTLADELEVIAFNLAGPAHIDGQEGGE